MTRPCTIAEYVDYWTRLTGQSAMGRTLARYTEILDLHIRTQFEKVRVRDLDRGRTKLFLADKLEAGIAKNTVRNIQSVLRVMLNAAMEDGPIATNPAAKLGRVLKLTVSIDWIQSRLTTWLLKPVVAKW